MFQRSVWNFSPKFIKNEIKSVWKLNVWNFNVQFLLQVIKSQSEQISEGLSRPALPSRVFKWVSQYSIAKPRQIKMSFDKTENCSKTYQFNTNHTGTNKNHFFWDSVQGEGTSWRNYHFFINLWEESKWKHSLGNFMLYSCLLVIPDNSLSRLKKDSLLEAEIIVVA